jgi:hypothetical protein
VPAHTVAASEETRAEHVVGAPASDRPQHALEVRGRVLAVSVEVDGRVVALVAGQRQPGAQGGAEAARGSVRDHPRAAGTCDRGGRVA